MPLTEIYDGISLSYNGTNGTTQRSFLITGLPTAPTNPSDNLALVVQSIGLPRYADPHPTINDLYVCSFDARPYIDKPGSTSKHDQLITIGYSIPTASQPLGGVYREVSSSNGQIIKNRWEAGDQAGQIILIGYKMDPNGVGPDPGTTFPPQIDPATAVANDSAKTGILYDSASFPIDSPNVLFVLVRKESSAIPGLVYRHSVNDADWQGFAAGTVFCREVHSSFVFGIGFVPDHYVCTYVFEAAPDPTFWKHVEIFKSTIFQKPVICNVLDGTNNGYTIVVPKSMDFNGLGFPNNLLGT